MMNNSVIGFCIAAAALAVSGCNITDNNSNDNNGGQPTISRDARVQLSLAFALDDAVALVANEDIVQEERSLDTGLFNYRVIGGPASRMGFSNRAAALRQGDQQDASTIAGSNLLALDAEGTLSPALVTNFPLKVMYTVANPSGDKIYIALDPGWFSNDPQVDADGNWIDFSRVIAEKNCALFEVTIATNAYSCVSEGVFVQSMDDAYMKAISGNQKPIQFDGAGNLYFSGTDFSTEKDVWENCFFDDAEQAEVCETQTNNWINQTNWQPRIFKREVGATTATTVTQDNEHIEFFSVLKSGELVYQSRNESTGAALLKMLQSGSLIDLTDGTGWGLDFFTVDDRNTVIFGQAEGSGTGSNGLRFARPRTAGGVEKASLDTSLFGGDNGGSGWGNPKPRRLLVGDNGRIYGVFEGGRNTVDANGLNPSWEQTLTVYQILPFDGVPKLELSLGQDDWWSWMQNTPFQVSGDMLYFTDSAPSSNYGTGDVIVMVDLNTRLQTQLLTPANDGTGIGRYEIYNWRLAGDELHFSGLKKDNNKVVTGVIDTALFDPDVASSEYLTVTEVASASGAVSAIQDIEVIRQVSSEVDPLTTPILDFFQSMENLFSMSIDFSASMDLDSVEANLSLVDGSGNNIDMMKVWVNRTLHLIPDLDGLDNSSTTTALTPDTIYNLKAAAGTADKFGNKLVFDDSGQFTTRPNSGWYTDSEFTLVYAGRADANWAWSTYDFVGATIPDHFELTFDAKNFSYDGIELMLFDKAAAEDSGRTAFRMGLNGWSWLDYLDTQADFSWVNIDTPDIFNGSWKTYRIQVYGNSLMVETKPQDAGDGLYQLVSGLNRSDLATRTGSDNRLLLRVIQPVGFDNFRIKTLDSAGNVTSSAFYTENFSGGVPGQFSTDLTQAAGYNDIN